MKLTNFIKWLRALIEELKVANTGPQTSAAKDFTTIVSLIVTGLVSNVIATFIAQEILSYSFPLALVIGMVIVLSIATVLQVKGLPITPKPLQIVAFLLTLSVIQSTIIAYLYVSNQPLTTYLVFDATESTIPYYGELIQSIRLTAQVQHPKSLGGLRVYGGQLSGKTDCGDTTQLITPINAKEFEEELNTAFSKFNPIGNASLTTAVLKAVRDDLKQYRGPIKLVVITGGIDPKCDPQVGGGIFEEIARDIRTNTSQEITIAIVSVGDLSSTEETTLQGYADAFSGTYLNVSKPNDLDAVLLASPSYFKQNESGKGPEQP